jgi:Ca2+/Na+ antiporter
MAEKMKMSDNVAGVTLLALGNGAPGMYLNFSTLFAMLCIGIPVLL